MMLAVVLVMIEFVGGEKGGADAVARVMNFRRRRVLACAI